MYYTSFFVCLLLLINACCDGKPYQPPNVCGYQGCNLGQPGKLNVHIVPHTHDDVGWIRTVEEYFYGAHKDLGREGVQYILDSSIEALLDNPERRFIYVEIAFFWRWWREQTEEVQNTVRELVDAGRLEFIAAGWCMQDEATTHYNSIIDQHSLGAEFLRNEFSDCARPKIGWQIDPFGHSREVASLFAQMGFDGMFFGKFDYQDHEHRIATKTMELLWKASANLGRQSWLFTDILPRVYSPPSGFCYDIFCNDEPIMDNPKLHDYNVPDRVQAFIQAAHDQVAQYTTNHIIMTMGSDFQYVNAHQWFKNLDKLIKYVNQEQAKGSDVNVFYSTPSCYLYALNKANQTWTTKTDDFFPYAMAPHLVRTGFYTSRVALKRYERYSNNILQVTRQVNAFANITMRDQFFSLNDAMGIVQHHDAISGTEQQHVTDDYVERLSQGVDSALVVINSAYAKLLPKEGQSAPIAPQYLCQLLNISECLPIEKQERFTLTLWNPTVHPVSNFVRVPVTSDYTITDPTGKMVSADLLPIPSPVLNLPGRVSTAHNQLLFKATLPSLGFNTYYFHSKTNGKIKPVMEVKHNEACVLENQFLRVEFDNQGNLVKITNTQASLSVSFTNQGFFWYQSYPDGEGSYVFRPLKSTPEPFGTGRDIMCTKSGLVQSALVIFSDRASQQVNLYDNATTVEVEWSVGPIPTDDKIGRDIIIRYDTDMPTAAKYYTDANGREVLERIRNYRPTWNYTVVENVSSNYYPVNSRIWIKDQQRQFTILTDRTQGGSSLHDGSVELMLHRRIFNSDPSSGMKENLDEQAYGHGLVARGKHLLILDSPSNSARVHRTHAQQLYMQPISTFALTNLSYTDYSTNYRQTWSALVDAMPQNLHLLTLDQLAPKKYLVRVEHYFELNEDSMYSQPIEIDLQQLIHSFGEISDVTEMVLIANMPLSEMNRLNWTTTDNESSYWNPNQRNSLQDTKVTLNPMQIKTFEVTVQ